MYIFNFHLVEPHGCHPACRHITITPKGLRHFVRMLRRIGLTPVSMRDVVASSQPFLSNPRYCLLTFDDGYENFYRHAAPVLLEEKCPATVFALAGHLINQTIGTNDWDQGDIPKAERDKLMTLEQLQSMAATGLITFGSHGLWHRHLPTLSAAELDEEIQGSYDYLSQAVPSGFVPVFAYPWGEHSPAVIDRMANTPYRFAVGTEKGIWTPETAPFTIPRYSIYYRDGNPLVLLAKLARYRAGIFSFSKTPIPA